MGGGILISSITGSTFTVMSSASIGKTAPIDSLISSFTKGANVSVLTGVFIVKSSYVGIAPLLVGISLV